MRVGRIRHITAIFADDEIVVAAVNRLVELVQHAVELVFLFGREIPGGGFPYQSSATASR